MSRKLFVIPAFLLCLLGCSPEDTTPGEFPAGDAVTSAITVAVEDAAGNPLSGATVIVGNHSGQTNASGIVHFSDISIYAQRTLLTVKKNGFFKRYRVVSATENGSAVYIISLSPVVYSGNFTSASGGTVNVANGGTIVFPANAIVHADGSTYAGTVNVAAVYLDPYSEEVRNIAPDNFLGLDENGQTKFLVNKGMMMVELLSGSGEELQIKDGTTAELHIPIAPQDQPGAASALPMYYFDETAGGWKEDGQAVPDGDHYTAAVSHFSFWMCPQVYDHYFLTGQFTCGGTALAGHDVYVYNQWGAYLGTVQTGPTGAFSGMIPEILTFTLQVDDLCGNTAYAGNIGPFTSATNLPPVDVCTGSAYYGTITGSVQDCNGNPDVNAFCRVESGGFYKILPANLSGTFHASLLFCSGSSQATVTCINPVNQFQSTEINLPINTSMNFGTVTACTTAAEFCEFTLDGTPYYFTPGTQNTFHAALDMGSNRIDLRVNGGQTVKFSMRIPGTVPGTYSTGGSPFHYAFNLAGPDNNSYLTVVITSINPVSGGTVEGYVQDGSFTETGGGATHQVTGCSFRFILD